MKIQRLLTIAAAGLLVLSGAVLVSCQQAAAAATSASYAGTAKSYFVVHQSGILAEAVVSTDTDGNVTSAAINEWMDPSSWVYSTGTNGALVGGEIIRMKMVGKNPTLAAGLKDYTFFYYNLAQVGWVEFTPSVGTAVPTSATAATTKATNFDLKMSALDYAKAYATDSAAASASAANTDLTTVTFSDATIAATTVMTVAAANAATQMAQRAAKSTTTVAGKGALNKSSIDSAYFPMTATQLGYRTNLARLITVFKARPTANYAAATQVKVYTNGWLTTDAVDSAVTIPATTYAVALPTSTVTNSNPTASTNDTAKTTAKSLTVWTLDGTVDGMTGATYSDFPNYALGLQTAYLYAIGEGKTGDVRSVQ